MFLSMSHILLASKQRSSLVFIQILYMSLLFKKLYFDFIIEKKKNIITIYLHKTVCKALK